MYLSKVTLSSHDSYAQHQDVWSLFPGVPDKKRDHLFRVEQSDQQQSVILLQSSIEPKSSQQAQVIASKAFKPSVSVNGFYKFKVLAYPTKRINKTQKVIEIKGDDQQVEWLQKKLSGANVTVTSMQNQLVSSSKTRHSRFVCFEGILQVIEPAQIERVLVAGIGRKKHAGAGLLSLSRTK